MKAIISICIIILVLLMVILLYFFISKLLKEKLSIIGINDDCDIVSAAVGHLPALPVFYFGNPQNRQINPVLKSVLNPQPTDTIIPGGWIVSDEDFTDYSLLLSDSMPSTILCKTKTAFDLANKILIKNPKKRVVYTGFTSLDLLSPSLSKKLSNSSGLILPSAKYRKFLFIENGSKANYKSINNSFKKALIDAWQNNPSWPKLHIASPHLYLQLADIKNIKVVPISKIGGFQLQEFGVQFCFNNNLDYINKIKSCETVVIYNSEASDFFQEGVDGVFANKTENLSEIVNKIIKSSDSELQAYGLNARKSYLQNKADFEVRLTKLIEGTNRIPKIIHMMWLDKERPFEDVPIPEKYQKFIQTWMKFNPDFKFMFWNGKSVFDLISQYFPQYLKIYTEMNPNICRCDLARMIVVYCFGGLYTDLDFYCFRNVSEVLTGETYFINEPYKNRNNKICLPFLIDYMICNGLFAACHGNNFIQGWIEVMINNFANDTHNLEVLTKTGPIGLGLYFKTTTNSVLIGDTCDFLSGGHDRKVISECKMKTQPFAVTYWVDGSGW
jgi:mannosyltransferase OCH1-like enzyme